MATAARDSEDNSDTQDELTTIIDHQDEKNQDQSNSLTQDSDEVLEMFCEHCEKEQGIIVTAECFCEKCSEYFCIKCLSYHQKYKPDHTTQDHTNMPQDLYIKKCQDHSKELIKFYCMSCQQKACSLCKVKNHSECKIEHIPSIVGSQEFKNEFRNVVKTIENDLEAIAESKDNITTKISNVLVVRQKTIASMEKHAKGIEDNFQRSVWEHKQKQTREIENHEKKRVNLLAKWDKEKDELINKHQTQNKKFQENEAITIVQLKIKEETLDKKSKSILLKDETKLQDLSSKADQTEMKLKHLKQTLTGKMSENQKCEVFLTMQEANSILENTKQVLKEVNKCQVSFYGFEPSIEKVSAFQTNYSISYGCIKNQSEIRRNIKWNNSISFKKEHATDKLLFSITGLRKISDSHLIAVDQSNKSIKILDIDKKFISGRQAI